MSSTHLSSPLHSHSDIFIPSKIRTPDRDSINRDKERLQRFHKEAMSFLSKAYSNDDTVLIEDRFDNPSSAARSQEDFLSLRRVELDRIRLERFHAQAVSFLDRAYADEPDTIVVEEKLSPGAAKAAVEDKVLLQRFHAEAMNFLQAAASGDNIPEEARDLKQRTSWRIERDKVRLEQHYQDAMSFLDRADADKKGVLIEEQELEPAFVDRFQLQKYAQEAMSFLDKAFRNDASVMVGEEEQLQSPGEGHRENGGSYMGGDSKHIRPPFPSAAEGVEEAQYEEEKQIAADRAALERYDEEYGDFLSKAYLDDATVIVEDAESETSGTERGLYARRMAPSSASGETPHSGSAIMDEFSEEAYTDDEFQDPPDAESSQMQTLKNALPVGSPRFYGENPDSSGDVGAEEGNATIHRRMMQYEREAADYLDGANVSVDGEDEEDEDENHAYPRPNQKISAPDNSPVSSRDRGLHFQNEEGRRHEIVEEAEEDDDEEFGADRHVDDETIPSGFYDDDGESEDTKSAPTEFEVSATKFPDRLDRSRQNSNSPTKEEDAFRSSKNQDLLVGLILEDNTGRSREWSDVPLEKSFYRQVPRGSTIKLRPRMSPQMSSSSRTGSNGTRDSFGTISIGELQRVERERDALMSTLEEIVNERSMLAAQVSEMKAMITSAGGGDADDGSHKDETEDIDLAAELSDAHETMSKLTEEMEATLGVLDNRYQNTLGRAHKAEEKCIRLESNAARMEKDFSKQAMRLSQALSEESRLTSLLHKSGREMEMLRKKAESDMKRLDDAHREEVDRSVRKILELTTDISILQERVKGTSTTSERRLLGPNRKLEVKIAGLKRRIAESDMRLIQEQSNHRKTIEEEGQKARLGHDREVQRLTSEIEKLRDEVRGTETTKRDLKRSKAEVIRMTDRMDELERQTESLKRELKDEKRGHMTAEAEASHLRTRYEESLKKRMARLDQDTELTELDAALTHLKEEAGSREKRLQQQLAEFRMRAEQAESAAARAAADAKEAAEVAKLTQERARVGVESERRARREAEREKEVVSGELKRVQKVLLEKGDAVDLVKSGSRRGMRKKREYGGKGGGSEEGEKEKRGMRPRLFG